MPSAIQINFFSRRNSCKEICMANVLRNLPSVNELLESPALKSLREKASHNVVVSGVRNFLENFRANVQSQAEALNIPSPVELAERIAVWIRAEQQPTLRPVINATGVLLHTGLGRAPLADAAVQAITEVAAGYASVEVDLESGERSQRVVAVERLLTKLTGAEAAAVVNNNAGATLLALAALAPAKEVIVSRGQLIEIGGSYRLPEVMAASGAILKEVGTTNKTRIADYAAAVGERTGALLRAHSSNYVVVGFTEETPLAELVSLGRQRGLPVIDDIGSGALIDFSRYGIQGEPVAGESVKAGADVVLFSGDKLLGGPQCGIIVGKKAYIQKITQHPMMRALRVDKLTLAALAATLVLYQDLEVAQRSIPLLSLLSTPLDNLKNRAERLAPQLVATGVVHSAEVVQEQAYVGGGSVPTQQIGTWCIALAPAKGNVETLATALRTGAPAVMGRIKNDRLLLDLRSVLPRQDMGIIAALEALNTNALKPTAPLPANTEIPTTIST